MNPFGLNEAVRYAFTSQGLVSDHRPSTQSPLGLFCPEFKAHDRSWLGRSGKGGWHLLSMSHRPDGKSMNFMTFSLLLCETGITGCMFQMRKTRPERLSNLPRIIQSCGQDSNPAIWFQSPCSKNQNIMGRVEVSFDTPTLTLVPTSLP